MAHRIYLESNNSTISGGSNSQSVYGIPQNQAIIGGAITLGVLIIFIGFCAVTYRIRRRLELERTKKSIKISLKQSGDNSGSTIASDIESLDDAFNNDEDKYVAPRSILKLSVRYDEQYCDPAHAPSAVPYYLQTRNLEEEQEQTEEKRDEDKDKDKNGVLRKESLRHFYPENESVDGGSIDIEKQAERKIVDFFTKYRKSQHPSRPSSCSSKRSFSTVSSYPQINVRKNSFGGEDGNSQYTGPLNYDDFSAPSRFSYYMQRQQTSSGDSGEGNFLTISGDSQAPTVKNHISLLPRRKYSNKQLRFLVDEVDEEAVAPETDDVSLITFTIEEEVQQELIDDKGNKSLKCTSDDSGIWIKLKTTRDTVYPVESSQHDYQIST